MKKTQTDLLQGALDLLALKTLEAFYRSSGTDSEDTLNERIWP